MTPKILMIIIVILLVQQALAIFSLYHLYCNKPRSFNRVIWNIIIILVIFVGPIAYNIIEHKPNKKNL